MRRTALRMSKSWARPAAAAPMAARSDRVAEQPRQSGGQGVRVARRDEEAVDAVVDHLRGAPDPGHHRRAAGGHGLDQGDRQALVGGGQGEGVEGAHQPGGIGPEPGEHHRPVEAELAGQAAGLGLQRPLADQHEADRRDGLADLDGGPQQGAVVLGRLEVGHAAHHRRVLGDAQLSPDAVLSGNRAGRPGRGRGGGSRPAASAAAAAAPGSGSSRPPSRRRRRRGRCGGRWPGWRRRWRGGSGPRGCARCRRPGCGARPPP